MLCKMTVPIIAISHDKADKGLKCKHRPDMKSYADISLI